MKYELEGIKGDEQERAYNKCLAWFFAFPTKKIGLTELSKLIKSSKTGTKQAVETLIKKEYVIREIIGKAWTLISNQNNSGLLRKRICYHLDKIYESGIVELVRKEVPQAKAIILFGSYRYGVDTEESDIDIAVEKLGKNDHSITIFDIEQLGYRRKIKVNLHKFSRKIDLNLFSNIANGIILDGFLEVRP